jgi:hypothetical protein
VPAGRWGRSEAPADLVLDREILRQQREPLGKVYGSINRA